MAIGFLPNVDGRISGVAFNIGVWTFRHVILGFLSGVAFNFWVATFSSVDDLVAIFDNKVQIPGGWVPGVT